MTLTTKSVLLALLLLPLAGCGSGSSSPPTHPVVNATAPPGLGIVPASRATVVMAKGPGGRYRFVPLRLVLKGGAQVRFVNQTSVEHTVTFRQSGMPDRTVAAGRTLSLTFTRRGTFSYYCKFHPYMTGVVVVQQK